MEFRRFITVSCGEVLWVLITCLIASWWALIALDEGFIKVLNPSILPVEVLAERFLPTGYDLILNPRKSNPASLPFKV